MTRERVDPAANPLPDLGEPAELDDDARLAGAARVASGWIRDTADRPAAPRADDPPPRQRLTIDQSTAAELDRHGEAIHPGSGLLLKRDKESGAVTAVNRATGEVFEVSNAPAQREPDPRRTAWTTGRTP